MPRLSPSFATLLPVALFTALQGAWPAAACAALTPPAPARAAACPATFNDFLARFAQAGAFREAHTRYPLRYQRRQEQGMREMQVRRDNAARYPGARFPTAAEQEAWSLDRHVSATASGTYTVEFVPPEGAAPAVVAPAANAAQARRRFVFGKAPGAAGCWTLQQVLNDKPM